MPSAVKAAMDHRLVSGMTCIYQGMQMSVLQVTLISAVRISVLQDSTVTHSSREIKILALQITKCLDFRSDNKQITL